MIVQKLLHSIFLFLLFSFQKQQPIEINAINNTKFNIERLNIYSQNFNNLRPKDTSDYKSFIFDGLTHNSAISLKAENKQFIILIPPPKFNKNTIVLDSLNIKNRIIYYSELQK